MSRAFLISALVLAAPSFVNAKTPIKTFIDVHKGVPKDLKPEDMAGEHKKDLAAQKKFPNVHFTQYWYDATAGTITCECEAPTAEDCVAVHKAAHEGQGPDEIHEVIHAK